MFVLTEMDPAEILIKNKQNVCYDISTEELKGGGEQTKNKETSES